MREELARSEITGHLGTFHVSMPVIAEAVGKGWLRLVELAVGIILRAPQRRAGESMCR